MNIRPTFPATGERRGLMRNLVHVRPISGWKIYDPLGVWVGNVDTLLLDTKTGAARLAWTSFFDIGEGQIALPWRAMTFSELRGSFVTLVTKRQMMSAPKFTGDEAADDVEHRLCEHYRESLRAA